MSGRLFAVGARGLAAAEMTPKPWFVGCLQRWAYLCGDTSHPADAAEDTPYRLEIFGDWRAAATAWAERGRPYDAAIAQLSGDAAAVESAPAKLGVDNRTQAATYTLKPRGL
jgi:hypothetical protein